MEFSLPKKSDKIILALGPESAGNYSLLISDKLYLSDAYGDLLVGKNYSQYRQSIESHLASQKITPDIILHDLHPSYITTAYAMELSLKYQVRATSIQHHLAHIFSAVGDAMLEGENIPNEFIGLAADGTGYGFDERIWGGEVFDIKLSHPKADVIRIGHLENQVLIGGDLAINEPARMLISILNKFLEPEETYLHIKRHYDRNSFNLLSNQLRQNFNCYETSSSGRILDAASVLLGFTNNHRLYKHEPIDLLEENSSTPYDLEPLIYNDSQGQILSTTHLFKYLINNLDKDKTRLAATAQTYIGRGLIKMVSSPNLGVYFAGGMANNKIISSLIANHGAYLNKKIPRGDAGISFGQIIYYLLTNPRD